MAEFPLNVPSDDALTLLDAEGPHPAIMHDSSDSSSDTSDTEDPVGRGQSRAGKKDMFVPRPLQSHSRRMKQGNRDPQAGGFQMTPGASIIP